MKHSSQIKEAKQIALTETKPNTWIYIMVLALAVVLAFSGTTKYEFVNIDDQHLIYEKPLVIDPSIPYTDCFKEFLFTPYYKPLVFFSWKAENNLLGTDAYHYHLINWVFHLVNTILVFFLGINLFRKLYQEEKKILLSSFFLALLFSVNPLRIESVAWATERKDVLFSFFFLLSWLLYIQYVQTNRYLFLLLGSGLYLCSGLSKSMGLPLLAILFLTDFWFVRKFKMKSIIEKLPYLIVFLVLLVLYGFIHFPDANNTPAPAAEGISDPSHLITSVEYINSLPYYVQMVITSSTRFVLWVLHNFIPVKLSILYPHNAIYGFFGPFIFAIPFLLAGIFWWAWKNRKRRPHILGGLIFFTVSISPVLVQAATGRAIFLSDRYMYIPSIGLFFTFIVILNGLNLGRIKQHTVFLAIALCYLIITVTNIKNWKNSETLFTHVLTIYPESGVAHFCLGTYYRMNNQNDKALTVLSEGIKYDPGYFELYDSRGKIYFDQGKLDLALFDLNKGLSFQPNSVGSLINRGSVFATRHQLDSALSDFNKAFSLAPQNPEILLNRGHIYFELKEYRKAIDDLRKYLLSQPNNAEVINTIGVTFIQLKDFDQALTMFDKCISINNRVGAFFKNRSEVLALKEEWGNAMKDAVQAEQLGYKLNPDYKRYLQSKNNTP